jgi:hypothetical protein
METPMAETPEPLPPLHDPARPDAWAVAYVDGRMSDADRATFEAHLATHRECRRQVELLRLAFPLFDRVLMEDGPPRSGTDYLAVMHAEEAKLRAKGTGEAPAVADVTAQPTQIGDPGKAPRRGPFWLWVLARAGLLAAAVAVALFRRSGTGPLEPELLLAHAPPPAREGPLPPWPVKMEISAGVSGGAVELRADRLASDAFTAVALVDARSQRWLVRSGELRDPTCAPDCGPLSLRIALDRLPPGPFRLMVLLSSDRIVDGQLHQWLPQADQVAPRWLGARAYAVARLTH